MNGKQMTYAAIGFVSGVVFVILIGFLSMTGMMWWGRGRMMNGRFGGRYNNCNYPQLPQKQDSSQ